VNKPESIVEGDAEQLLELFESGGPFVSARSLSDYWLYARLFSSTCLCVRNDAGSPVAALIAFRDQTPGVEEIYIQDVVVAADYRRQGLGGKLLEELHQRAGKWGVYRIWLTSEADNAGAMQLWHQFGYANPPAAYQEAGVWLTRDLKGPGRDRAVYEYRPET
jgi:GNAT superfamily N-acetyltransferase